MPAPKLTTDRLHLRAFVSEDAGSVRTLAGNLEVADTTLRIPHPYPDGAAEAWIAGLKAPSAGGTGATFAITLKANGELVGTISLMSIEAGHQAELGYWIGVPYWGQGFCTEAGQAVVDYAFTELGLVRLHASHFSRNPASGRVLEKLGFRHEGTRRGHVRKWGKLEDLEIYGLVRDA
ncbi:MAG: GNAT family N-acetyltransferase [Pseudomonadales bacterium]|nr:GNAT family N-acetyltransferase [Pseudomonadales bacterium]NIX08132.1 GNAT family N-acetyltransferase [Pseudomonadales bacterium]